MVGSGLTWRFQKISTGGYQEVLRRQGGLEVTTWANTQAKRDWQPAPISRV